MATTSRSLTKAITYRVLVVIANAVVVYTYTKSFSTAIDIAIAMAIVGTLIYFFHERLWSRVMWGKQLAKR